MKPLLISAALLMAACTAPQPTQTPSMSLSQPAACVGADCAAEPLTVRANAGDAVQTRTNAGKPLMRLLPFPF